MAERTCERCGADPDLLRRTHGCTDRTCPSGGRVTAMDLLGIAPDFPATERQDAKEVDAYAQTIWDMLSVLGWDTDGDRSPAHVIAGMGHDGYRKMAEDEALEFRNDQNDADNELDEARKANALLEVELRDLRAKVDAVRAVANDWLSQTANYPDGPAAWCAREVIAALGEVAGQDEEEAG